MNRTLSAMIAQMAGENSPTIDPEAALARLEKAAPRFFDYVPFKVRDLVTPRADAPLSGAGEPHIVIAVDHDATYRFDDEPGTHSYGAIFNMRVLSISRDSIVAHWVEAAHFERYTGPGAQS